MPQGSLSQPQSTAQAELSSSFLVPTAIDELSLFIKIIANKSGILQAGSESAPRAQSYGLGLAGLDQGCWDEGKDKQESLNCLKQPDGRGRFHPITFSFIPSCSFSSHPWEELGYRGAL